MSQPGQAPQKQVTRRQFLKIAVGFALLATAVGVATPIIGYLWPPARRARTVGGRVLVASLSELPAGQAKKVVVRDKPVLVINTGA